MESVFLRRSDEGVVTFQFQKDCILTGCLLASGGVGSGTDQQFEVSLRMGRFATVGTGSPDSGARGVLSILFFFVGDAPALSAQGWSALSQYVPLNWRVFAGEFVTLTVRDLVGTMNGEGFAIIYCENAP